MRGKLLNIKNLLLAIFIVGSIFYAPHANGQAATMTTNITTVCAGSASPIIKFTYTGTGNEGSAPYTFTYKINDGTDVTVTTVTGDTVSIFVPTNIPGTYKYTLVSVAGAAAALLYFWINPLIFGRWHFTELMNIGNRDCLCCPSRMALILRACKFCSTPLFYWLLV